MFHVLAHIYQSHFKEICCLKLHPHLNTVFQHYSIFNREFKLVEEKETDILSDLLTKLEGVSLIPTSNDNDNDVKNSEEGEAKDVPSETTTTEENKENESMNAELPLPPPPAAS